MIDNTMIEDTLKNELVDLLASKDNISKAWDSMERQFQSKGKVQASTLKKSVYELLKTSPRYRFLLGEPYTLSESEGRYVQCFLYDIYNYVYTALDLIDDDIRFSISHNSVYKIVDMVRYDPVCALHPEGFNRIVNMINCQNGIVEIRHEGVFFYKRTIEMLELMQPNYCVAANFQNLSYLTEEERLKQTPVFNSFCRSSFGEEQWLQKRTQLLEVIGYSLSEFPAVKKGFFLIGEPDSGKSITLGFLAQLLGPNAAREHLVSAVELHSFTNRFSFAQVCRAKMNINAELATRPLTDISNLKLVTGNDNVTVEDKGKNPETISTKVKLVFAGNDLPPMYDLDPTKAFYNRIHLIYFPKSIPIEEQIRDLPKKIWEERDAIFSEAMLTLVDLLNRKFVFTSLPDDKKFLDKWHKSSNSFVQFFNECIFFSMHQKGLSSVELSEKYSAYCKKNACPEIPWTDCQSILRGTFNLTTTKGRFGYNASSVQGYKNIGYDENAVCQLKAERRFYESIEAGDDVDNARDAAQEVYEHCVNFGCD